jgi:transposase
MAKEVLSEELWKIIQPLLPEPKSRSFMHPGRKRVEDRKALTGILFVLITGIGWEYLPKEMGCGSGMTCWRRLRDWNEAGVWKKLHKVLLQYLQTKEKIDWSRAIIDSSSVRAVFGGGQTGPSPTDRRKNGSKHHILTDGQGTPLASKVTSANRHDVTQALALVDSIQPIAGKPGRPRFRPEILQGDRAYGSKGLRLKLLKRGIFPKLAKRYTPNGSGLGVTRWVFERTLSWIHQFRRLRTRFERRLDIHQAFLTISCCIICFKQLTNAFC